MLNFKRNILCLFLFLYLGTTNIYAEHNHKTSIVKHILPAVVEVIAEKDMEKANGEFRKPNQRQGGFKFRNQPQQQPQQRGQRPDRGNPKEEPTHLGSGFVISEHGHIITNAHVISNCIEFCSKITVVFHNEESHEAKLVNYDEESDIALLKIIDTTKPFHYLKWGKKPELGSDVIAIGSPMNQSFTVTFGNVSSLDRFVPDAASFVPFIQTDAAINPGNSGGPLFNEDGEIVGINTMIITGGAGVGSVGIGFAIDGNYAQSVIEKLYLGHKIQRPFLGIMYRPVETKDYPDNKYGYGAYVQEIVKDSPAFGVIKEGDIILKVDGEEVKWRMLASIVKMKNIGDTLKLEILREGMHIPLEMILKGK